MEEVEKRGGELYEKSPHFFLNYAMNIKLLKEIFSILKLKTLHIIYELISKELEKTD